MASSPRSQRPYDIVLFGATGFTGALTAEYLAKQAPKDTRWALAGRNRGRLESLRNGLGEAANQLEILEADVSDAAAVRRVAESARVVITTVGPYVKYGEPFVAACAAAGTDYVDLTGEPEFIDRMYLAHHAAAERSGARIVHACGFDSIPHDLGAQFTVEQLPSGVPLRLSGFVNANATFSGGTFATALGAMSRLRTAQQVHRQRRAEQPALTNGRQVRAVPGRPGYRRDIDFWVLPMPTIDPQIVVQSAAALEQYGPDFRYSHLAAFRNPLMAAGAAGGMGTFVALAQIPPLRPWLEKVRASGDGPSPEQIEKSWFRVVFVGDGGGQRVVTEVTGGDPGYGETSKMLAESALSLAFDDLPETSGMVTTAVAMGPALRKRLQAQGISFQVLPS